MAVHLTAAWSVRQLTCAVSLHNSCDFAAKFARHRSALVGFQGFCDGAAKHLVLPGGPCQLRKQRRALGARMLPAGGLQLLHFDFIRHMCVSVRQEVLCVYSCLLLVLLVCY